MKKTIPRHIIIKLFKTSYEKKILKIKQRGKRHITYRETNIRITSENSSEKNINEKIMD